MAIISLIDTGYNTADRDGNQRIGTDITSLSTYKANLGSAIELKCPSIRKRSGINISDEPNPSSNEAARTHFNSFNNAVYEIDFIINIQNQSDRDLLKQINILERTSGVKLLYASTTSDVLKTIPELIGRTDTKFNSSSINGINLSEIPILIGRVIGTSINQISTSRKFAISGTLTFVEERVVKST